MIKKFSRVLAWTVTLLIFSLQLSLGQTYNLKDMPPLDPKVRTGVLDNGMHYYIRSNKMPANRGEFYIAHNVGAILEDDDQNGLAHFTEHMAFNGTDNFPKKGILDYLATIGVKFGTNVNASTGLERTVYNLSNVPLSREGIIDTALLILHDWSNFIAFEPVEVDLERGVILEEWRMYGSAEERMSNKLAPVIYKGSKYAIRNVIGDTAVIKHFKHESIKNFYHKWYRPDLQAIVIVGDFDENLMEAKIKKLFNTIPRVQNPAQKPEYSLPDNKEPLVGTATDPEATTTSVRVSFKHDIIRDSDKNLGYMRLQLLRGLINGMLGQRMSELSRKENPPFISAFSYYGGFTRTKDAFTGVAQAANNEGIRALTALLTEMERMKRFGFTAGELERTKADNLRSYESRYMERDKRRNRELVQANISNFLSNNPNPGSEFEYDFAKFIIPGITLDEINNEAKKYVGDDNIVVTVTGPEKEGTKLPGEQEIRNVLSTYKTANIEAYVDNMSGKKLIEKDPVAGKIGKIETNKVLGTTEWTLGNGMHIIFKPTDFKEDELIVRGYSAGGTSQLRTEDLHTADFLGDAISQMGVADFNRTDLTKMLAGKRVNVNFSLTDDQDVVNCRTTPRDLETALQLIYLSFTRPRFNESDFKTWLDKIKSYYVNAQSDPRRAYRDTLEVMQANHNKRVVPVTYKTLDEVTLGKIQSIFNDRFSDPGNFTFQFVGKINPVDVKPLFEKYLASLPTVNRNETYKDDGVRPPKGHATNDFKHETKTPRTNVYVNYHGTCPYNFDEKLYGAALRHVLELRVIESIREDEGGAYSPRVGFNLEKIPEPGFQLVISFETDPAKADKLVAIVHKMIKNMVENGPAEADLQKAKEYFLKQRQEDLKENFWWSSTISDYYFNNLDNLTGYETKVQSLNVKSLHEYAKRVLTQGNILEVIMRPI